MSFCLWASRILSLLLNWNSFTSLCLKVDYSGLISPVTDWFFIMYRFRIFLFLERGSDIINVIPTLLLFHFHYCISVTRFTFFLNSFRLFYLFFCLSSMLFIKFSFLSILSCVSYNVFTIYLFIIIYYFIPFLSWA